MPGQAEIDAAGNEHDERGDHRQAARPRAWLAVPALAEDVFQRQPPKKRVLTGRHHDTPPSVIRALAAGLVPAPGPPRPAVVSRPGTGATIPFWLSFDFDLAGLCLGRLGQPDRQDAVR